MLLTIGMMVKNEEKHLAECLSSLDSIREEIDSELVIVDTGSDDNTVEIAKEYTDKVYFHEWNDNFSEMRNTVINYAKGDWYFSLDGDEIVNNPETIINFFKSGKHKKYNAGLVTQKNYTNLEENRFSKILVPRLFKNDKVFCFKGAVHNQPQYKQPVYGLDTILDHYGYVASDEALIERKFQRTSNILKQELEKDPTNVYYWFQLSKSYNMHKDQEDALDAIEEAYKVARENDLDLSIRMYVLIQLAKMYLINNRYKMAEKIAKNALDIKDGYVDLYYYLARAQLLQGKKEEALNNFKEYIKLINNYDQTNSKNDTSVDDETMGNYNIVYRFIIALAADLEIETDYAINLTFKIDIDSQLQHAIHPFISICLNNNRYMELKKFYLEQLENKNLKTKFINLLEKLKSNLIIEEKEKVNSLFTDLEDNREYSLLNKVRENIYQESYQVNIEQFININYNTKPDYYGDIVYYLLKMNNDSAYKLLTNIREENLNRFISYLNDKYDDLSDVMMSFVDLDVKGIAEARVNKSLSRYLLALDNEVEKTNKTIIENYLSAGKKYIEKLYTKEIIENELIYELKSEEEAFLLYIYKAFAVKENDLKAYIQYLRKAIDIYPLMKKVVETLMIEIKEKQDKINIKIEKEKKMFKNRIENLINKGQIEEAKNSLEEYQQDFERDADIYSMLGVIALSKGNNQKAEKMFKEGLKLENNNPDLFFNLAYIFENNEEFLKALENYEKAVFNMKESTRRLELIKYINKFEKDHKKIIQSQLENRNDSGIEYIENPKYKYVHLMYDNFYCNKFMHFTNEHFDEKDHLYLLIVPDEHEFKHINFDGVNNIEIISLKNDINKLNFYLNNTNKIFIHYLFDHICRTLIKLGIKKELYWVLYGGDLYNHIDKELHSKQTKKLIEEIGFNFSDNNISINSIYRKSIIRKMDYILTDFIKDFSILNSTFINNSKRLSYLHPTPVDFSLLEKKGLFNKQYNFNDKYDKVILVGNSANSLNNHIDILYKLKQIDSENFCIVMPLSYSGHDAYVNKITSIGNRLFNERFIPLSNYLDPEIYSGILKQVDIAIFNHNRQQAVGNIWALLYTGAKIYLSEKISTYKWLKDLNLNIKSIEKIKWDSSLFDTFEDDQLNKTIINKAFNKKQYIFKMDKIFNE